ncbi:MAG: flagellar hook-length control protein FliK [Candidatus Aminicenantes bacterium]|nr:flagellar hook-length control protein FliK [Candidatus Aminicenantes bacterium]
MNFNLAVPSIDNFKEVMNTAYIPASIANIHENINNTDANNKQAPEFRKELEEKTNLVEKENNRTDKGPEPKPVEKSNPQPRPANEPGNSETKEDTRVQEKPNREQLRERESGPGEKTGRETVSEKGQVAANNQNNIKEILQKHQLQSIEFAKAKETSKENFSDAQKINSNQNAEKVILKNLEDTQGKSKNIKVNVDPAKNAETPPNKTNGEKNSEPVNIEKNDTASALKNETTTEKKASTADNNVLNIPNLNARETQSPGQVKFQELLPRTNIQEQYEAFKNQVVNSLENSIKFMIAEGEKQVSIKLYPPELGKIQVELVIKDNQVHARINTENIAVKEVILTNLDQLKSNIESAGIIVNRFDVEVGGFRNPFDRQSSNGKPGNRRIASNEIAGAIELSDNDWLADKVIQQKAYSYFLGRSIDYLV